MVTMSIYLEDQRHRHPTHYPNQTQNQDQNATVTSESGETSRIMAIGVAIIGGGMWSVHPSASLQSIADLSFADRDFRPGGASC